MDSLSVTGESKAEPEDTASGGGVDRALQGEPDDPVVKSALATDVAVSGIAGPLVTGGIGPLVGSPTAAGTGGAVVAGTAGTDGGGEQEEEEASEGSIGATGYD